MAFLSVFFSLEARQAPPARLAHGTTAAHERRPLGMSRRALLTGAASLPVQGDEGIANSPIRSQTSKRTGKQLPLQPPSSFPVWFCIGDFLKKRGGYVEFFFPLFGIFVANGTLLQS